MARGNVESARATMAQKFTKPDLGPDVWSHWPTASRVD